MVLCVTSIILCRLWFKSSHKRKKLKLENDKLEQLKGLIIDLKGEVPPENYLDFLKFSEQILTMLCDTCTRNKLKSGQVGIVMRREEVRLNLGTDETDGGDNMDDSSDSSDAESDKEDLGGAPIRKRGSTETSNMPAPKDIVKALTNPVRAGLQNPRLRRRLRKQLSTMVPELTTPTASARWSGKPEQEPLVDTRDGGYNSRSTSGSSVPGP